MFYLHLILRVMVMNCKNLKPFHNMRKSVSGDLTNMSYNKFSRNNR